MSAGEGKQPLIAARVCSDWRLGQRSTDRVDCCGGEVSRRVSTPMTPSIVPASPVIAGRAPWSATTVMSAWRTPRGRPVTGHTRNGLDRLLISQQTADQVHAGTHGRHPVTKATRMSA
jgi:hypothetical protein